MGPVIDGGPAFPFGISNIRDVGLTKRDYFATHAHIDDVNLAEADLLEAHTQAGMLDVDPLTLRIKARYVVADRMLRVRGEM